MRKQNDFDLYKIEKTNPRIFKIKQLIKKSLGEIFCHMISEPRMVRIY